MGVLTMVPATPGCDHAIVRADRATAPISWWTVGIAAAVCPALAVALVWLARAQGDVSAPVYTSDVIFPVVWTWAGVLAWKLRPGSRSGVLMLLLGVDLFVNAPFGWHLPTDMPLRWLVTVAGAAGFWTGLALAGHLLLTYPSGRTENVHERRFVRLAYASAAVVTLGQMLLESPDRAACGDRCPVSPVQVVDDRGLFMAWYTFSLAWFVLLAVACVVLLVRRYAAGGRRWRRQRTVTMIASIAMITGAGLSLALNALGRSSGHFGWLLYPAAWIGVVAVPGAFLVGLLRDRVGYASVADLVRGLDEIHPYELQAGLSRTLQDPDLVVLFPVGEDGDFVDIDGQWIEVPTDGSRALTMLGPHDAPVAALLHDPSLSHSPKLLEAAGAAARLALQNARLQAEVRAQLAEVRASRARIVAAADDERQRLERNLHDGAQQRLFGIGMTLQMLRGRLDENDAAGDLLDEAELELRAAIQELRELAQGIHPAVLTDEGLVAGVGLLARRSPVPVRVDALLPTRPSAGIEAAAYYIVSEALQNVVKHAGAASAVVCLRQLDGSLEIVVSDDGIGGASLEGGSGLRGMADRAMALDGTVKVRSQPGEGTELMVRLPCE
jgi:signal transduction histidine kinase